MRTRYRRFLPGLALAVTACGGPLPERSVPDLAVRGELSPVADTTLVDGFEAAGIAEPVRRALLASKLMTRVTEVLVQEGDQVRAGSVLVRLDARDIAARSEQVAAGLFAAEAGEAEASAQARRIRALYADSAAPRVHLDQAEAALARAEAAVRQARAAGAELEATTEYATVRAPFSGTITQRLVDPGAIAAPGQALLSIEDQSQLRIAVSAPPDAVRQIRRGQRLTGAIAGQPVVAVVEGVVPSAGHMVTVNALVPNNDRAAMAGSAATLTLPQGSRVGLTVPEEAVIREGDLTGVYLRRNGRTELRWVRLGQLHGARIEVLSGVGRGDTVIVGRGTD